MKLAIKGHPKRGNEVIERLEMLGGINKLDLNGTTIDSYYYIDNIDNKIHLGLNINTYDYIIYTLEEFLEKFPYKVGDKVYYDNKVCDVIEMLWNSNLNNISYGVCNDKIKNLAIVEELQPYKEETMETITIDDFKANTKEWLIDKLHGMIISNAIKTIGNIHDELHKPQYPKTYEECCKVLDYCGDYFLTTYDNNANPSVILNILNSISTLTKLLICRNVYWKIAGEQMGLGKSWKQDYDDRCFIIANNNGNIHTYEYHGNNNVILAFPTEEMRDAFYENFKELIENCKELL